jgi:ribosomal protein L37E
MLKIYCTECGSPTTYTSAKPKFCSSCGKPFDKLVVNKVQNQKQTITKIRPSISKEIEDIEDDYEDSETEVNYVPEVSKIDCEIIDTKNQGEKIGSIVGTSSGQPRQKGDRQKGKRLTKADLKKFREDFAKEAGALRPKSRGRKNA